MDANEIIPNLWLGNIKDSINSDFIDKMDIIINCTKDIPFNNDKKKCIRIPVDDNLEKIEITNLYKFLDKITNFIHLQLRQGKKIFVHCFAGKQRSASVITAYLMKYTGLKQNQVIDLLKTKRPIVFEPLCNFDSALKVFEMDLKNNRNLKYN